MLLYQTLHTQLRTNCVKSLLMMKNMYLCLIILLFLTDFKKGGGSMFRSYVFFPNIFFSF